MEFKNIGDTISVAEYNALVYLLRKFKRLTTTLQIGNSNITSDFGNYHFTSGFKSFGDNWIITDDVTVTSSDVLRNCFYSFVFTVLDVNLSGEVNKRFVTVTSESTGDTGTLELVIPVDLIGDDEVILPDFRVDVVFDEHEYYTPLPDITFDISVSKRIISSGESTVITGVLTQKGVPLEGRLVNLDVGGTLHQLTTDSQGKVTYTYTGTGDKGTVVVSAFNQSAYFYDGLVGVLGATFTGNSVSFGRNIVSNGDVIVDWGDGTTQTINNPPTNINHTYADGESSHIIVVTGEITSLGEACFYKCSGLTSVTIPESVTNIGKSCFYKCSGLTSVTIPESVTNLAEACFYKCSGLTSISIPSSVTSIGGDCFTDCSSLTSVTIPESVTNIGDYCFSNCSSLIDYELYWESNIITYVSSKMPNNPNTFFYIPIGTKQAYINKNYPSNKLVERGYKLTVTGDKSIIQSSETSTITAKLVNNEQPVSSESLSYTIKHDNSIIDSGTVTTDSTGTATISYTGSGVGEVNITVEYGTLLQETYEVFDCLKYDKGILSDHNDSLWSQGVTNATFTRETDYSELLLNEGATSYGFIYLTGLSDNLIIDFDFYQVDGTIGNGFFNVMNSSYTAQTWFSLQNIGLGNESIGKWISLRLELNSDSATLTSLENPSKTLTKEYTRTGTPVVLRFIMGQNSSITSMRFKNIKIYSA